MSRELLANLTARGTKYDRMSAGTVRPENLAFLLVGLKRGPLLLAEWKDLGREEARKYLWAEMHTVLKRMPVIQSWYNFQILDILINLALFEVGSTAKCPKCEGRKWVMEEDKPKTCPSCLGLGLRGMTDKDRAEKINIPWTSWRRTWRSRYRDVYSVLLIYDQAIARNVKKRLSNK